MDTIPFDTHAFVKELIAAGFSQQQAEAQVQVLARLVYDQLATKRDLKDLELALKRDLSQLESATKRDIKDLELALKRDLSQLESATKGDIVELQKEIVEIRRDIAELKAELKRDIKELESSTKRDLKELEMRLTIRLGAMLVVAVGVLAVLQKLL